MRFRGQRLNRFRNRAVVEISLPRDQNGLTARQCPQEECRRIFKVELGTGLKGSDLPFHCAYCGHTDHISAFHTEEQIDYGRSVVTHEFSKALLGDLKEMEFDHRPPRGGFGIGISLKVKGRPTPIKRYIEEDLETEVTCENCSLHYAVYGVFAFCPDCGVHNSRQILERSLDLVGKKLGLARSQEDEALGVRLVQDSLADAVGAFDGFGRELVCVHKERSSDPLRAERISFQRLTGAKKLIEELFGIDIAQGLSADGWAATCRSFQKRHVFAHRMGVVDQAYLDATGDAGAQIGRMMPLAEREVTELLVNLRVLGRSIEQEFSVLGDALASRGSE